MNLKKIFLPFLITVTPHLISAQTAPPKPSPTPPAANTKTNGEAVKTLSVSRERRQQAYQKMLEGQKYLWSLSRQRSKENVAANLRMAKLAFQAAVELDPTLSEGYTALAETAANNDEALMFAGIAAKISPDNFGSHQIAAKVYTIKSRFDQPKLNPDFSENAVKEWLAITRLDPRNAEGWAFLSEFYLRGGKLDEAVKALKKWRAAATPNDPEFYKRMTNNQLSPETAGLKLASVQFEKGDLRDAIETASTLIADAPDNVEALELLRQSVETADGESLKIAEQALQQAIYANPANESLITLYAEVKARTGKPEDAAKILSDASARLLDRDKAAAANLQIRLGDIYAEKNRTDEAVKAFQTALSLRGVDENQPVTDEDRDFTITVLDKIIESYKKAKRPADALKAINQSRLILGGSDLFADSQLITFYRDNGKNDEALTAIRRLRAKNPEDYGMLRLEAQILTDGNKVDQAVALIRPLLKKNQVLLNGGEKGNSAPVNYDDFTNYLFISNLYTQANRGKESVEAANQALSAASGEERRQIAQLTLASAQQSSGDFAAAEDTLRAVLKKTPDNPTALNNLGYFLLERDAKIGEAFNLIQQAVKIEPSNPSFLDSLGWAYFKQGNLTEAENYLTKAAKLDANSATIQEHLGDVYGRQGKFESAKSAWQNALTLTDDEKDVSRLKAKIK